VTAVAAASVVDEVVESIRAFCRTHSDPAIVAKYAKFFREGYDAYGTDWKDPLWQETQLRAIKRLCAAGGEEWLEAGDALSASGKYEEFFFAIRVATEFRSQYTPAAFERIGRWLEGDGVNWAGTDTLAGGVLSTFLIEAVVPVAALLAWVSSPGKFMRRAVPVTLIKLLKGSQPLQPLLDGLRPLMMDRDRVVHQGVGWFLREAWRLRPEPVEAFLLEYRLSAPRLIYQYATEKMSKEAREGFRRK
jgi:3-methyladenine DNA glycosylase AlkD